MAQARVLLRRRENAAAEGDGTNAGLQEGAGSGSAPASHSDLRASRLRPPPTRFFLDLIRCLRNKRDSSSAHGHARWKDTAEKSLVPTGAPPPPHRPRSAALEPPPTIRNRRREETRRLCGRSHASTPRIPHHWHNRIPLWAALVSTPGGLSLGLRPVDPGEIFGFDCFDPEERRRELPPADSGGPDEGGWCRRTPVQPVTAPPGSAGSRRNRSIQSDQPGALDPRPWASSRSAAPTGGGGGWTHRAPHLLDSRHLAGFGPGCQRLDLEKTPNPVRTARDSCSGQSQHGGTLPFPPPHLLGLPQLLGKRPADPDEALLAHQGGEAEDCRHKDAPVSSSSAGRTRPGGSHSPFPEPSASASVRLTGGGGEEKKMEES